MDLKVAIPTLNIQAITFSQFLIYSRRVAISRLYDRLHMSVAARSAQYIKSSWKEYINELLDSIEEISGDHEHLRHQVVTGAMISKTDLSKSNINEDDYEWLE